MHLQQIQHLATKYREGSASKEEEQLLHEWYNQFNAGDIEIVLTDLPETEHRLEAEMLEVLRNAINGAKSEGAVKRVSWAKRLMAAASVLVLAGAGGYIWWMSAGTSSPEHSAAVLATHAADAESPAGGNRAVLTLADGTRIILDSAADGKLAQQGTTGIIKLNNGRLAYQPAGTDKAGEHEGDLEAGSRERYNTITTPNGGQYQIVLPDGSRVWLNAASSIRFPPLFTGNARTVSITGEAYIEIAADKDKPFKVTTADMEIDVLGTSFNLNAYEDEAVIKTTLIEGSVRVQKMGKTVILKPGEQASISSSASGAAFRVVRAELNEVIAWKNGFIQLENADIATIMRQIARWYDVDIVYERTPVQLRFGGGIDRKLPLSRVLKALEINNIKCKLEGRKLTVL